MTSQTKGATTQTTVPQRSQSMNKYLYVAITNLNTPILTNKRPPHRGYKQVAVIFVNITSYISVGRLKRVVHVPLS